MSKKIIFFCIVLLLTVYLVIHFYSFFNSAEEVCIQDGGTWDEEKTLCDLGTTEVPFPDDIQDPEENTAWTYQREETEEYYIEVRYGEDRYQLPELVTDFIYSTIEDFKSNSNVEEHIPVHEGFKERLVISYDTHKSDAYLTYSFLVSIESGGIHSSNSIYTITFDANTADAISITELLKRETELTQDFAYILSDLAIKKLEEKYGSDSGGWYQNGAGPDIDNFSNFYVKDGSLVIIFSPYQVGPYAWGIPEIAIPFSAFNLSTSEE